MDNNNHLGKRIANQSNIKTPFTFTESRKIKPFVNLNETPNGEKRFAILRTTENGKYVRGDKLWFKLDGVEIYTDINSIIFVDMVSKTFVVQSADKILKEIIPEDPNHRQYILLMKRYESNEEIFQWESMTGRIETYNYIVDNIEIMGIDPKASFVLTENVPYKDALTIADFVRYLKNSELVENDGFEIDDYIYE